MNREEKKIHIIFNAREEKRIVNPILEDSPDIIYYFYFKGYKKDVNMKFMKSNLDFIRQKLPTVEIIEKGVDYVDYYAIMKELVDIIREHEGDTKDLITVNLGTGSKMVAIAIMDAQRLWKRFDLIYPYSEDYDPDRSGAMHVGKLRKADIPDFNYQLPTKKQIQSLQCFYWKLNHDRFNRPRQFVMQKDWQEFIFEKKIIETTPNEDKRKEDSNKAQRMSKLIIQPLRDKWKFITTEKVGKSYRVRLTDPGENFVRIIEQYNYGVKFKL